MTAPARTIFNAFQVREWTLAAHAEGKEACGIVCGDTAFSLKNDAPVGRGDFVVSGETLNAFFKEYPTLLDAWNGVWHSHPSGQKNPSADDLEWHPKGKTLFIATEESLAGYILSDDAGKPFRDEEGNPILDESGEPMVIWGFQAMWNDPWE